MNFRLLLLLEALLSEGVFSAHAQPTQVDAVAGETIILPCTFITPADKDLPTVEWSKEVEEPKPAIVFLYRDGCETFEMKNPDFEYRTHLFMRELQNGNYSLRISDVKLSDAGMYQCLIIQKNGSKEHTKVHLVVASSSDPKLSVVSEDTKGVTVGCEALCWEPAPLLTLLDNKGNRLTDTEPEQERDPRGCYNTKLNATLHNPVKWVVCRVDQRERSQSRKAEILLPGLWEKSYSTAISLSVFGTALVCLTVFFLHQWWRKKCFITDEGKPPRTTTKSDQTKKSDPCESSSLKHVCAENEHNTKNSPVLV